MCTILCEKGQTTGHLPKFYQKLNNLKMSYSYSLNFFFNFSRLSLQKMRVLVNYLNLCDILIARILCIVSMQF